MTAAIQTPYLVNPLEDYHQISLDLDFAASSGRIVCDPNSCSVGPFGDRQICTLMAPVTAEITLVSLEIADTTGQGRTIYGLSDAPLRNNLTLVAPHGNQGDFRLVHTARNGQRRVVSTEPTPGTTAVSGDEDMVCTPLAREVDGTIAAGDVRPGFINNTWILFVGGKKPNLNTTVRLQPRVYVRRPEYWGFDVLDCRRGDITLPQVAPYIASLEVTQHLGTRGVEIFWADQSLTIDVAQT